ARRRRRLPRAEPHSGGMNMKRYFHSQQLLRASVFIAFAVTPGCTSNHGHLYARGTLAERAWAAEVDHPIARDYLEGRELPLDLREIRDAHLAEGSLPSESVLSYLTTRYSPDTATLFFLEAVSAHEPSRSIQREYGDTLQGLMRTGKAPAVDLSGSRLTVAFAPGWFYESYGAETGADFQKQLDQLARVGVPAELIETDENGTVESNAEVIADAFRRLQREGRQVLVVSGSKSGAEVAIALGDILAPEEATGILAWLSIGGVHQGSPLADWALNPTVCWISKLHLGLQGFDLQGALSLQTSLRRDHFAKLQFPEHLLLVSYVPVPLSGDISNRGAFGYSRMRHLGPNDGLTMLVDQLLPGGLTIVEPGVDHYFDHPNRELRSLALLEVLLTRLGETTSRIALR
ncbi:MAG: hypothetical protein KJO40_06385, partial [Deltaproteobacteria bacterium]|nr:hypothetical protein [Deltaproteobacteria bacterium]